MNTSDVPVSKSWTVRIDIGEHEGSTRATAHLQTGDRTSLMGTGIARLNPSDRNVPEIGDELAAARALSALAHELLDAAAEDMSAVLHEPVDLAQ